MRYNPLLEISALLFLVVIAVHFFTRRRYPSRLNLFFAAFIILGLVDVAADIASAYVIEYSAPLWLNWAINMLLYYCQIVLAPLLYVYILCLTGLLKPCNKRRILLSLLPGVLTLVLLGLNPLTRVFFYFDRGVYTHGPYFILLYAGTVLYLLLGAGLLLWRHKNLRRVEYWTMLAFIILIAVAVLLQYLYPHYLLTGVALSLAIVMMYLTLQNPEDMLDPVSGMFNRHGFLFYTANLFAQNRKFQVLFLEVEGLNAVNGAFGIAEMDKLVGEIGSYLRRLSGGDRLSLGGNKCFRMREDGFAIITHSAQDCARLAKLIRARFGGSWRVNGLVIDLAAYICCASEAYACKNVDELLTLFANILPQLHKAGPGEVLEISAATQARVRHMADVEKLLRRALDARTVDILLQPICRLTDGYIIGMEALARLRDEEGNTVMPGEFIPIAERAGLIARLGEQVMDKSCAFLQTSGLLEDPLFKWLCINLSPAECMDESLVPRACALAARHKVDPSRICFEITETTATLSDALPQKMEALRAHGFYFAMDDFGTGYANYDAVMRLPFCAVKMDKTMLDSIAESAKNETVFFRIIDMMRALGFDVVVEGVETRSQANRLKRVGVRYAQGYYFYRPMPPQVFLTAYHEAADRQRVTRTFLF